MLHRNYTTTIIKSFDFISYIQSKIDSFDHFDLTNQIAIFCSSSHTPRAYQIDPKNDEWRKRVSSSHRIIALHIIIIILINKQSIEAYCQHSTSQLTISQDSLYSKFVTKWSHLLHLSFWPLYAFPLLLLFLFALRSSRPFPVHLPLVWMSSETGSLKHKKKKKLTQGSGKENGSARIVATFTIG